MNEPTSTDRQPDRVSSRQLPPLSSFDRMRDGEKLGPCPRCGGHRWWDNSGRKAAGQMPRDRADYVCAACRYQRRIGTDA